MGKRGTGGRALKGLVPRWNMIFGRGWACFLSRPFEQRDSGEFSPEIMLQKPAEPFEMPVLDSFVEKLKEEEEREIIKLTMK